MQKNMLDLANLQEEEVLALMPRVFVEEFSHVITMGAMIWLIGAFGGTDLYISKKTELAAKMFPGLSQSDISSLCQAMGGNFMEIPVASKLRQAVRHRRIMNMHDSGIPQSAIASEFGMTQRSIRRIVNSSPFRKIIN